MVHYTHLDIKDVFVCGDIHGEFKELFHTIKTQKFSDCVVIIAGDCGFGFNKLVYYGQLFNKYNKLLEAKNIYIYFVRGNHDDPTYFDDCTINYEHCKAISDYSVISVNNKNILCVGGAISIDRIWRKQEEYKLNKYKSNSKKQLYWNNEAPYFSPHELEEITSNQINIDCVVTHSSPHMVFPLTKGGIGSWAKLDNTLLKDIEEERQTLTNIYNFLKENKHNLQYWYHGHYHTSNTDIFEGTLFKCIGIMEIISIPL
jgi:UDP-2,3-diacylglucosamine pyrophosphatase LpxH